MTLLGISTGLQLLDVSTATVTTAGTPVQLTAKRCKKVVIQSAASNANLGTDGSLVAVGDSGVDALSSPPDCIATIYATQREEFLVDNAADLWIDATENNTTISYAIFG